MAHASDLPSKWETAILEGIGATPGANNVTNLGAWNAEEGGADVADAASYNPFNTKWATPGSIALPGNGVMAYPNWTDGRTATIGTLNQENMNGIKQSLIADVPFTAFATAVNASPWGTHFDLDEPEPATPPDDGQVTPVDPTPAPTPEPTPAPSTYPYESDIKDTEGKLAAPISAACASPTGKGYLLVGKDGGVFAFGDAKEVGSLPALAIVPAGEIVAVVPTATGDGYVLIGSDGGVFAFGDAVEYGNLVG